jgi:hypothetical protein
LRLAAVSGAAVDGGAVIYAALASLNLFIALLAYPSGAWKFSASVAAFIALLGIFSRNP